MKMGVQRSVHRGKFLSKMSEKYHFDFQLQAYFLTSAISCSLYTFFLGMLSLMFFEIKISPLKNVYLSSVGLRLAINHINNCVLKVFGKFKLLGVKIKLAK